MIFLQYRSSTPDILRKNTGEPDSETQSAALGPDTVSVQVKRPEGSTCI